LNVALAINDIIHTQVFNTSGQYQNKWLMKNRIYFYITFVLLNISCNKDDVPVNIFEPGAMEFGSALAEKNGLLWLASAEALKEKNYKDYFALSFSTYNVYDEKREGIGFLNIPYQTGVYPVYTCDRNIPDSCISGHVSSLYTRLSSDGDAVLAFYIINAKAPTQKYPVV